MELSDRFQTDRIIADGEKSKYLLNSQTAFSINESYKAARTNLTFLTINSHKKIIFTSPSPSEGKTLTCINMGIAFAQNGSNVLLIDADLRKPKIHRYLKTSISPGLSNKLAGYTDSSCICQTSYKNLYVMTSGHIPPNPAELLASPVMSSVIQGVGDLFDYVFIDTPPVNIVTDAAVLSGLADGVVMVARQNATTVDTLKMAVKSLNLVEANILGIILNDVDKSKYSYKYRSGYSTGPGKYDHSYEGYQHKVNSGKKT